MKGRSLNEAEEDEGLRQLVWDALSKNPINLLWAIPRNFLNYWWEPQRYQNDISLKYLLGRKLPYVVLLLVSIPGVVVALQDLIRRPNIYLRTAIVENSCLLLVATYTVIFTIFGTWNL